MNNYSVLIVEDERIVAKDIQSTLVKQGYRVVGCVSSGEKALEQLENEIPDVVLMDVVLDGEIDGIETAQVIHEKFDVPVVFLTAFSNSTIVERAKLSNPYGYILKPFQEREIQIVIEMAVYKHQTEKKIRENKEFISAIVDSIGDGIIATNHVGEVTYMNTFAERILSCTSSKCIGKHYKDVFVVVGDELWTSELQMEFLRQSIRSEFPAQVWLMNSRKMRIPIEGSITPIKSNTGAVIGEVFAFRDMSDRKAVQDSLIDSEMRFRLLAENSLDLITLINKNGTISYASPSHLYVLGYHPDSLMKEDIYSYVHLDSVHEFKNAIKKLTTDHTNQTFDIKFKKNNEQIISVEAKISLVYYKGQNSILVVSRDITSRKHAEKILAESEAKYRTMIECLNEGIIITDLEDTILFANSPAADLLYKPIEKLVGYKAHEVIIPNGSYSKDFESRLQKRKQGISERYTEVIFNTDGKERVIEISAAPYKNAEGEVVGTVGAMYDITEQMKSQQEVIAAKEKFENLVLNAPVGIIRWLINERKYEFANREFERQSSMKLDEFTALTHDERLALIHPDDRERATAVANEWIESGAYTPQEIQYRTYDKNGTIRWSNTYIYGERNSSSNELESITQISVDITELKSMQEALSIAQQEDFRRTVKNLQNLVVKMYRREDGEFVYSLREGKLAGELTTDAVNGKTPRDLFGKDYETKTLPFLQRTFNGESVSFEAELPDGRYFYFTLEPLFENDLVNEIVGSAVEITNQKQISKELHESENKFKTLTDVIPIGITQISHLLNGENIVDYVNPEFTRQSFYTLEKFIEKSKEKEWSFIHPDDKPMIIEALTKWHSGNRSEPFRSEYRFLRDDGKYIWLEVYLTNYEKSDGTMVGIQAGVDITQKKIVEQKLQHLASFPEQIPDPIIELSEDGTVTYLNPEAQNYFPTIAESGFDHKVLCGLPDKLHDIKSGEMSSYSIEIEYNSLYFEERVFYIAESNTFRVFLYDITDRKRNETELEKTLKKERELYSLKSRFLTTVSHEFRTPLTGIQISAEILASHAAKMDFNQRINEIDKIKDRVHDLTMLMNDFSMQSTIDSIEDYYNPTTIILTDISKLLNYDVGNFIRSKSQQLEFSAPEILPEIVGDERMLRQCFSNIILNASKYSAKETLIKISVDVHENQWITVNIEDEGIGIPPDELHTLFTPFSRASNIGTRPGIGLGLSIAKDILEYHGGTLNVKSTLNVGSIFTVFLPIADKVTRH